MFDGLWDGLHFLPLTEFCLGALAIGAALTSARRDDRWIGGAFLVGAVLTLGSLIVGYDGLAGPRWQNTARRWL